jgi:plasmid stabilization system protein ParE
MSLPLRYLPEAKAELHQAIAWFANKRKGLGKQFASAVKQALKPLRKMPKMHGIVIKDVRRALVKGFSYAVLYRVTDDEVIIISIFQTSQDPSKWQSRI